MDRKKVCINHLISINAGAIPDFIKYGAGTLNLIFIQNNVKLVVAMPFVVNQPKQVVIFNVRDADGTESKRVVHYKFLPSNLGAGEVPYFVCPVSGELCKKLFLKDSFLLSRKAFCHYYRVQHLSHSQRLWNTYYRESSLKNRKRYYKGRLTPFGFKVIKEKYQSEQAYRELLFAIAGSLKSRSGRAGRSKNAGR